MIIIQCVRRLERAKSGDQIKYIETEPFGCYKRFFVSIVTFASHYNACEQSKESIQKFVAIALSFCDHN